MDIKQIRNKKAELEKAIFDLIDKYEKETQTTVTDVSVNHTHTYAKDYAELLMVTTTVEVTV